MANILPFYVVCDESASMQDDLGELNESLQALHYEIGINPVVCDKTRFAMVGFSDTAQVHLPLADFSTVASLPELKPRGATSYAAAFTLLKDELGREMVALKAQGHRVFRPSVFFISDGLPTDRDEEWRSAHRTLMAASNKYRPNLLAFGIKDADAGIIKDVGVTGAWIMNQGIGPALALREFAKVLTRSIVASTQYTDVPSMQMPTDIYGFTPIATDEL